MMAEVLSRPAKDLIFLLLRTDEQYGFQLPEAGRVSLIFDSCLITLVTDKSGGFSAKDKGNSHSEDEFGPRLSILRQIDA